MTQQFDIQSTLSALKQRKSWAETEHADAVRNKRWSQVAGLDGIVTGLAIAINTVQSEISMAGQSAKSLKSDRQEDKHVEP